jgi:hypothetical protein
MPGYKIPGRNISGCNVPGNMLSRHKKSSIMIVKIIPATKNSASFPAIGYNTGKLDKNKGELMMVSGFGPLEGLQNWRPEDYRNYLKAVSATNKAVKLPQFHAVISAEGKSYDKHQLTEIATKWLAAMGYGDQPYLLVYHKDTKNNHIHIVTTRVNKQGKKISDSYENLRAQRHLNAILGIDEKHSAKQDIAKALSYAYSTKAQLMMILECQGYTLKEENGKLLVIKFGHQQGEVDLSSLKYSAVKPERVKQLKAIFHKYAAVYDTALSKKAYPNRQMSTHYSSAFAEYLKEKHGLELLFHASADKPAYGYSVIDHAGKAVFKGSEIMPLKELLSVKPIQKPEIEEDTWRVQNTDADTKKHYSALLKAALYNYPDLAQGLRHQELDLFFDGEAYFLADQEGGFYANAVELLNEKQYNYMVRQFAQLSEIHEEFDRQAVSVNISGDVDDEAVHGRKRRRNKNR